MKAVGLTVTKFMVPSGVMCEKDFFISKMVLGRYLSKRSDSHLMGTMTSCSHQGQTQQESSTVLQDMYAATKTHFVGPTQVNPSALHEGIQHTQGWAVASVASYTMLRIAAPGHKLAVAMHKNHHTFHLAFSA